jgi:hypothetical protein
MSINLLWRFCMKEIPVHGGLIALIDDEDEALVQGFDWHPVHTNGKSQTYANAWVYSTNPPHRVYMHRLLLDVPDDVMVDHINRDGLDNRRSNLRPCTNSQNLLNAAKRRTNYGTSLSSTYKGVSWNKGHNKWRSYVFLGGKQIFLGYFVSEVDAALTYNRAATQHYGEFARLNDIP